MEEFSIKKLKTLVESRDIDSIKEYMNKHNLVVKDGKIVPEDKSYYKKRHVFWDQRQHARKILLNSLYGSILNEACRFFDQRVGQSVTLSGRSIVRHMNSKINEIITGQYTIDGDGIIYIDTDSVASDTIIETSIGKMTIEDMFNSCSYFWKDGEKEYALDKDMETLSYNPKNDKISFEKFNYIYRHKVKKKKYKINISSGKSVVVTEDHSIMIERNNELIEVKPKDINPGDIVISYK